MEPLDIDASDGDWIKRGTWDIPATNLPDLREWLFNQHITVDAFKEMPVYQAHVGEMPWLMDL